MATRNLNVRVGAKTSGLVKGMRTSARAINAFGSRVGALTKKVGGLGLGLTAVAGGALAFLGKQAASDIDKFAKLGKNIGGTSADAQELAIVSKLTGVGLTNTEKALQRLTRVLGEARVGLPRSAEAFEDLNLSIKDLKGQTPTGIFEGVVKQLGKVESVQERARLGNILFGREWQRLGALIEDADTVFARARKEIRGLGFGLSNDASANVEALNDNVALAFERFFNFTRLVTAELTPAVNGLVERFLGVSEAFIKASGGADQLASVFADKVIATLNKAPALLAEIRRELELINPANAIPGTLAQIGTNFRVDASDQLSARRARRSGSPAADAGRVVERLLSQLVDVNEKQLLEQLREARVEQSGEFNLGVAAP